MEELIVSKVLSQCEDRLTPSILASTLIHEPSQCEPNPLSRESSTVTEEHSRESKQQGEGADHESLVTLLAAKSDKLHTPVQSTEEREDDGAVGDLCGLERVKAVEHCVVV